MVISLLTSSSLYPTVACRLDRLLPPLKASRCIALSFSLLYLAQVYGGEAREMSDYYFQPRGRYPHRGKMAYTNSIYYSKALESMAYTPPTSLTEVSRPNHNITTSPPNHLTVYPAFSRCEWMKMILMI